MKDRTFIVLAYVGFTLFSVVLTVGIVAVCAWVVKWIWAG